MADSRAAAAAAVMPFKNYFVVGFFFKEIFIFFEIHMVTSAGPLFVFFYLLLLEEKKVSI